VQPAKTSGDKTIESRVKARAGFLTRTASALTLVTGMVTSPAVLFPSINRGALAVALLGLATCGCGSSKSTPSHPSEGGTDAGASNDWPTYAGSDARLFFSSRETSITTANVGKLKVKWKYKVGAALTASPIVVNLDLPGGTQPIVFVQSWDLGMNAIRLSDGSRLWRFVATDQPGANFPAAGSAEFDMIDGNPRLFFGSGEALYCLDATTGKEIWRFYAGTGCQGADGGPGLCSFTGERNEIESSPALVDGNIVFGMDVNDEDLGKGGLYAVDARTGKLSWFFDLDSGKTCRPNSGDDVDHFDGYHTAAELGLPANFFSTRSGCNFSRTPDGCENVWASAAVDNARKLMFFTTGNCDVDNDPSTPEPPPPGPLDEDAFLALNFDGTEAWAWRPRLTCPDGTFSCINADLDFGASPNLFSITLPGHKDPVDVVGCGDKSGTYYVIDRTGVNSESGVKWNDKDATKLPYWTRNVVAGGPAGGIIGTAAVDQDAHRIFFSTAPGDNPLQPQLPTQHALNADDGSIVWQNTNEANTQASYAPTFATPSLIFAGSMFGTMRVFDAKTGTRLLSIGAAGPPIASGIVVFDGIVLEGQGIGQRDQDPTDPANIEWQNPSQLTAYCVPGTPGC
jgi:polyvinyl alcohol dehydrogenase (cytochrome)